MKPYNEKVPFRFFEMPCCNHQLCWVNPRLPSYCPCCGRPVYMQLKEGDHTLIDSPAWLRVEGDEPKTKTVPCTRSGCNVAKRVDGTADHKCDRCNELI